MALRWSLVGIGGAALFAFRAMGDDALPASWPIATWLACSASLALLAAAGVLAWPLWWAAACCNLAAATWILRLASAPTLVDFAYVNLWAAAAPCVLWAMIVRRQEQMLGPDASPTRFAVHRRLVPGCVFVLILLALGTLIVNLLGGKMPDNPLHQGLALTSAVLASIAGLWDRRPAWALKCLYLTGLAIVSAGVNLVELPPFMLVHVTTLAIAAYGVLTSYLWSRREGVRQWAANLGRPCRRMLSRMIG